MANRVMANRAMADRALADAFAAGGLDWIVPQWQAPSRVHAFCTTRNGSVATGVHASLDLGSASVQHGDSDAATVAVAENRARVAAFLPSAPVWLTQVHGRDVVQVDDGNVAAMRAAPARADAMVTRDHDVVLAVRAADCVPVLFAARDAPVVAAAHAGWRGLASGVLEATLATMNVPPASIVAWLGPAIGARAFEVGADVLAAFCAVDERARIHFSGGANGKWQADLHALARQRLERAGVADVTACDACTHDDAARFFSFRRDGGTGRMAALIWQSRG